MRLNFLSKTVALLSAATVAGCATTAPDLPPSPSASSLGNANTLSKTTDPVKPLKPTAIFKEEIWDSFSSDEQQTIESKFEILSLPSNGYGIVIDVQGQDQSSLGTNGGAAIGGAVASAAYLDHALRGGNSYSAGAGLAIGLIGAAIGSSMDRAPSSQFQFRYTVKHGDDEIAYFDEIKSTAFRHSVGVCLLTPSLTMVSLKVCNQTIESAQKIYLNTVTPQSKKITKESQQ